MKGLCTMKPLLSLDEELIKKYNLKIKGLIHIGAHYGEEASDYLRQGIKPIILVEPSPKSFMKMLESLETTPELVLINKAFGSTCQIMKMNCADNDGQSNSLLKPKLHKEQWPGVLFDQEMYVNVTTVDAEMETLSKDIVKRINCISIDTQGSELDVFRGASNFLKQIDYIFTEISSKEFYENNTLLNDLIAFLKESGFEMVDKWICEGSGNALFVRV